MKRLRPTPPLKGNPILGIPRLVGTTPDGRRQYRVLLPAISADTAAALERARRLGHTYNGPTADGGHSFTARIPAASRLVPPSIMDMVAAGTGDSIAPYSSTSDGQIYSSNSVYATARAGSNLTVASAALYLYVGQGLAGGFSLWHGYLYFPTSTIGANSVITDATLNVWCFSDQSTTDFNLTVVSSTAAASLTTADWGNCGSTSFGSVNTSGISTVAYTAIPLNPMGRGAISKTGTTQLALRSDKDISATAPTTDEYIGIRPSEYGTSTAPYLSVTYTVYNLAVEGSTADGHVTNSGATYATVQAAATGTGVYTAAGGITVGQRFLGGTYDIWRGFLYFDTSSIVSSASIDSAVLYVVPSYDGSATDFNLTVVQGTQAATLTTADYSACGSTSGGTLSTVGIATESLYAITLDATGRGFITKGGTTKLALRSSLDISATAPTVEERIAIYGQDDAAGRRPVLAVNYTVATQLSGSAAGAGTATGAITGTFTFSGGAVGAGTAAGQVNGIMAASGAIVGAGVATGQVGFLQSLSGACVGAGTATATAMRLKYTGLRVEEATFNIFTSALSQSFTAPWTSAALTGAYTVSIRGPSGSLALSGGATGTVSAGQELTFTAAGATVTFTPTGNPTYCQCENKSYATKWQIGGTARAADSLKYDLGVVLPSAFFGCLWYIPDQAAGVVSRTIELLAIYNTDASPVKRFSLEYSSGQFRFRKNDGATWYEVASGAYSYNAGDSLFIGFYNNPAASLMRLYIGKNGATITTYDLTNSVSITDAKTLWYGCDSVAGSECNGIVYDPQIYDTAAMTANLDPFTAAFVDAIYANEVEQAWSTYTIFHATLLSTTAVDTTRQGIWVSPAQNASSSTNLATLTVTWAETLPAGTAIAAGVATSVDGATAWSAWASQVNGDLATAPARAYSKMRFILQEIGDVATPTLSKATASYDGSPTTSVLESGLSVSTHYSFAQLQDNLIIANGVDLPRKYNGTTISSIAAAPRDKVVCVYKNRVFSAKGSRISFSDLLLPDTWGASSYIDVNPSDGDEIIALVPTSLMLIIVKERSTYYLQGYSPATFSVAAAGEVGSVARNGFLQTPYGFFSVDKDGVWATDLRKRELLTRKIRSAWTGLNSRLISKAALMYYDDKLLCAVTSGGGSKNDTVLVWDFLHKCWTGKWTGWNPACFLPFKESGEVIYLFGSSASGNVYQIDGATDDAGTAFTSTIETAHLPMLSESMEKRLRKLDLVTTSGTAATNVGLTFVADGVAGTEKTFSLGTGAETDVRTFYPPAFARALGLKLRFISTSSEGPSLLAAELEYFPIAVRGTEVL